MSCVLKAAFVSASLLVSACGAERLAIAPARPGAPEIEVTSVAFLDSGRFEDLVAQGVLTSGMACDTLVSGHDQECKLSWSLHRLGFRPVRAVLTVLLSQHGLPVRSATATIGSPSTAPPAVFIRHVRDLMRELGLKQQTAFSS